MLRSSRPAASERPDEPDQLRRMIARSATPVAVALILGLAGPARADMPAEAPPQFSKADMALIERNATLRELNRYNPRLTYRVLRTIDAETEPKKNMPRDLKPGPFDEKKDPDLSTFQKNAPEAAADLFALIKRASGNAPAK